MAKEQEETQPSSSKVPSLTTVNMTNAQYKKAVEELSAEVFNLQTNLIALTEDLTRLSNANEILKSRNAELEMKQIIIKTLQTDNGYLRNNIKCSDEIE